MNAVQVQISADDYVSASLLNSPIGRRIAVVLVATVSMLCVLVGLQVVYRDPIDWRELGTLVGAFGGAMVLLSIVSRYLLLPRRVKRVYRQQRNLQRPYEVSWDDDHYSTRSEQGNARIPWNEFLKWRENKRLFLLYRSDVLFHMVPKAALSNEQVADFSRLIRDKIASLPGRRRKVS